MTTQEIFTKCISLGMTRAGAAGCTANILAESAGRPDNLQDSFNHLFGVSDATYVKEVDAGRRNFVDGAGFGYCQWTAGDRKKSLLEYCRDHGKSIADSDTQFFFMTREMRNTYSHVWYVLTSTNDPYEAGYTMCKFYEIPYDTENQAKHRGNEAKKIYAECAKTAQPIQEADAKPVYWPPRTVDMGMTGPDIALYQAALLCRGYTLGDSYGVFGSSTGKAVRKFQEAFSLDVDGVVGPMTRAVLLDERR